MARIAIAYLLLFSRSKIVLYVKCLSDFFRSFSFDHVGHSFTGNVQQTFDVQVIRRLQKKKKIKHTVTMVTVDGKIFTAWNFVKVKPMAFLCDGIFGDQ